MATVEQLKSLIRFHFSHDRERFATIALQLAAHEAKQGHSTLAHEIHALVDKAKSAPVRGVRFNRELDDLVISAEPRERLADLIVSDEMRNRIKRILREYSDGDASEKDAARAASGLWQRAEVSDYGGFFQTYFSGSLR